MKPLTEKQLQAAKDFIEKNPQFLDDFPITPSKDIQEKYSICPAFYERVWKGLGLHRNEELLKQIADIRRKHSMVAPGGGRDKGLATNLERYGALRSPISEETKQRMSQSAKKEGCQTKRIKSLVESKGTANNWNPEKSIETKKDRYGTANMFNYQKRADTLLELYGTTNSFSISGDIPAKSSYNKELAEYLKQFGLEVVLEKGIEGYSFDLVSKNIVIEINPTISHSYLASWSEITHHEPAIKPTPKNYHLDRWKFLRSRGYEQLSLFDWTDKEAFRNFLLFKLGVAQKTIGARKFSIKEISKKEASEFLDANHVLHSCKGNAINLALVDKEDKIFAVMTFGKPRHAKEYDFELLRFAALTGYSIAGGASKLFKYFTQQYPQAKIITYSDNNLGFGSIYQKLGFRDIGQTGPAVVWCNLNGKHYVKEVSLIMQGADRLLGGYLGDKYFPVGLDKEYFETHGGKEEYAKEYAEHADDPDWWPGNLDIMKHYGYFPVADCGATKWLYIPSVDIQ